MTKLLVEKLGRIATITLNRPEQGNAIDMDMDALSYRRP